jgi:hypothetical protein
MKPIGIISTAALFLLLGFPASATAQDDQKDKPQGQEESAKPEKQPQDKAPKQEEQAKPVQHEEQAKPAKQDKQAAKPVQQQHVQQAQQQHAQRTVAEQQRQRAVPALRLSMRGSGRIPDDRFRASFGVEHTFVINAPVMVGGYSRFQYGGFWFGFDQQWPVGWYYTDNVYVDFIDGGYYLYNPYYPGARVAINVVL